METKVFKTESDFQKHCLKVVRDMKEKHGLKVYAVNIPAGPYGKRGISDILLCIEGKFVAVELKNGKTNYKATPSQLRFLEHIESAGGDARVVTTFKEFIETVRYHISDIDKFDEIVSKL